MPASSRTCSARSSRPPAGKAIHNLGLAGRPSARAFWLSFVALQAIAGGYALRMDGERLRSLWLLPLQPVVHRQLMYLVTIQSVMTALLGTRQRWQSIRRIGVFAEQRTGRSARPA